MTTLEHLYYGFTVALVPGNILAVFIGAILGLIVGALPGIGALTGVALLLPLTFSFDPTTAVIMLAGIYYANMYGGAYSAILLNIPGDSSAVMTALDGYPLAKQNKAGKALFTANMASFVGGTIGMITLTFIGPAMAQIGIRFGPAEMASLLLLAMTSLGWLVGENPLKGMVSTMLGILIGTVGLDAVNGSPRFDFNVLELLGGVPFIPLVIGVFGFSQLISMMVDKDKRYELASQKLSIRDSLLSARELKDITGPTLRSGVLGTVVGILPGAGGAIGSFLGYVLEKKIGKNKENMGKGAIQGVAASEAANNSAVAGAFAPLLSLGIPGSGTTAVLLGGLIMWGLTPGPMLFQTSPEFTWGLIASLYVANVITLAIGMALIPFLVNIARVPMRLLIPIITIVCFMGSYSATNSLYGVIVMLIAGFLGFLFNYGKYPAAPFLLAYVLSPMLEVNTRNAFIVAKGSPLIFIEKPISLAFLLLLAATLAMPLFKSVKRKLKGNGESAAGEDEEEE